MGWKRAPLRIRFWRWVLLDKPPDRCWNWVGVRNWRGYGRIGSGGGSGRLVSAHRVAWELCRGAIPDGVLVLHSCDNTRCVRPSHLFLGSHQENLDDMVTKGRSSRGERNTNAKLTAEAVREMRLAYAAGETQTSLAKRHGVRQCTARQAIMRETWKHIA